MGITKRSADMWRDIPPETTNDSTIINRINSMIVNPNVSTADLSIFNSFKSRWDKAGNITLKQESFLKSLESKYDPAKVEASKAWISSFDEVKRKTLDLAIKYYGKTQYFRDLVDRIVKNPQYIPTENQYRSMCENKYFLRAVENYNSSPRYAIGDVVVYREGRGYPSPEQNNFYLVEEVMDQNCFQVSNRRYKLMVLGTEDIVVTYESDIKLYREPKKK